MWKINGLGCVYERGSDSGKMCILKKKKKWRECVCVRDHYRDC